MISDSVTAVGYCAFEDCDSLTSVVIPNSVTTIEEMAFANCESLIGVVIPDSVVEIGAGAFADCTRLGKLTVSSANPNYKDVDGVLFSKDGKTLVAFPCGKELKEGKYVIPDSVTEIGYAAFAGCENLIGVEIPQSVTVVGDAAFAGCENLTGVAIPLSVTTIGEDAFPQSCKIERR